MLEIKADFLVVPYHEFKICSLEPSLPDPDTAPLNIIHLWVNKILVVVVVVANGYPESARV